MIAIYFAAILVAILFFLCMIVAAVGNTHNRRIAALGSTIGATAGGGIRSPDLLRIYHVAFRRRRF